jgi:uncharacterized protein YndB with AHSA1/START domain
VSTDPGGGIEGSLHSYNGIGVVRISARYTSDIDYVWSALTEPKRLARWFGNVTGDLRAGGEFTAFVLSSGWDGSGRITTCVPAQTLSVTMWEVRGVEHVTSAQLLAEGDHTIVEFVVRGVPIDLLWAYGAGWQEHAEDLGAHLSGSDRSDVPVSSEAHFEELGVRYRALPIVPLEP